MREEQIDPGERWIRTSTISRPKSCGKSRRSPERSKSRSMLENDHQFLLEGDVSRRARPDLGQYKIKRK